MNSLNELLGLLVSIKINILEIQNIQEISNIKVELPIKSLIQFNEELKSIKNTLTIN